MLIVSRKEGQSILIGDDIEITISKVSEGNVKIGIKAPKDMVVLRSELIKEISEENIQSSKVDLNVLKMLKN